MATEEGIVIRTDAAGAWVKTVRSEACGDCSSQGMCHSLGGGREMEVAVLNLIGARAGDRVVLKLEDRSFLKATFLVYLFPILMLVVGASVGEWISRASGSASPALPALLGFGALAVGLALMRVLARRMGAKDKYRPRIVRVLGRVDPAPAAAE